MAMENIIPHKSRTDRHGVFKLVGKIDHVTCHELQLFKVKRSKVTWSRVVSADKNAITRQCMCHVLRTDSVLVHLCFSGIILVYVTYVPEVNVKDTKQYSFLRFWYLELSLTESESSAEVK